MLKIRDDVDLKELEKFGFINKKDYYEINFAKQGMDGFLIHPDDRIIYNYSCASDNDSLGTIYDLIKANLIVKE